ncbi:MAG: EAL domain-containing protein [Bacteroidota bacterium]
MVVANPSVDLDDSRSSPPSLGRGGAGATLQSIASIGSYAAVLNEIAMITTADMKGTILYANEQCVRVSRYSRDELIGANHSILNSGLHPAAFFAEMYREIAAGRKWRGEIRNRAKDGSFFWVDATIVPARGNDGKMLGYFSVCIDITDRKRAEETLKLNEQRAHELSVLASDWYWEMDADLRFTGLSEDCAKGKLVPSAVLGKRRWELPILSDPEAMREHRATLEAHLPFRDFEYSLLSADGKSQEWFSISGNPLFDGEGRFAGYRGVARSITQRVHAEAALQERTNLLQAIIDNFPGGISFVDDDMTVVTTNAQMRQLLDFPDTLFEKGPPKLEDLFRFNALRGEYGPGDTEEHVAARLGLARRAEAHRFERARPDGTVLEVRGVPLPRGGFVTTYTDVTERRQNEARIAHMARHDSLTDLPNRLLLRERLEEAIEGKRPFALLYLDLDRFKQVNDTFGHQAGDELLKTTAKRLRDCLRDRDTLARLSGDEFAIVQLSATSRREAFALAQRIGGMMSGAVDVRGHQMFVGVSIGIALWPSDGENADELLRSADLALYKAKSEGRGTYFFFEPAMDTLVQARRELELDLRDAVTLGAFTLDYQPIADLSSNDVSCCEALLRWNHPKRGRVSPADFVPLAEETGLIVPIGEWVLRQACADAVTWPEHVKIAVNLSAAQFQGRNLVQMVFNALASSGLDAHRLELEITESVFLRDTELVLSTLHQLRELGVRIALDDFGTGYSSLVYLQRFPFDKIKIDRGFVGRLSEDPSSVAILRAIAGLGHNLGMTTTAEGVETVEQFERVRAEGCSEMQGYLFSKPKSLEELRKFFVLRAQAARRAIEARRSA